MMSKEIKNSKSNNIDNGSTYRAENEDDNNSENRKISFREKILGNCRSVADFEKMEELGEGTYGRVCKLY